MSKKHGKKTAPEETMSQQIANYGLSIMTGLYVFCLLVFYPLYYDNKYYNMGNAKFAFFESTSSVFLTALVVLFLVWMYAYRKENSFMSMFKQYSATDWFVVAFLIFSYFSLLYSEYMPVLVSTSEEPGIMDLITGEYYPNALTGYDGWNMGFLSQLVFVLSFLFVSRFFRWSKGILGLAVAAAFIVYQLAVWQRFSVDPLNMYENLDAVYIEKFISTLGQTTWFSSYAVLLFPLGIYFYWKEDKIWIRVASGFFVAMGFASLCTANSDSGYIGYLLTLVVFFWFSFKDNKSFGRFMEVVLIGLVSFRIIGIFQILYPERLIELISGDEKISFFVTQSTFMLVVLILWIVLFAVYRFLMIRNEEIKVENRKKKENKKLFEIQSLKWVRVLVVALSVAVVFVVPILVVLTTKQKLPGFLSGLYSVSFFRFDDAWGNFRGFNWRMAMKAFQNAPLKDVLIGAGPDCFALCMDKYCAEEVAVFWQGMQLACAHNEFLNMLVTQGIFGVTAYLGIFFSLFIRCGKYASKEDRMIPFMAAVLAYLGHNFFCYQQCICTPTIFIFMGMGEMLIREYHKNEKEE